MKKNLIQKHQILWTLVILLILPLFSVSGGRTSPDSTGIKTSFDGTTLYVGGSGPGNYTRIQDAIDNATDGNTVFVFNGTYYEHVLVDKSIQLLGENRNGTIIDGGGAGVTVTIATNGSLLRGFRIQNGGYAWWNMSTGILVGVDCTHNIIRDNCIIHNADGIELTGASDNQIRDNIIEHNGCNGINLFDGSYNNSPEMVVCKRNIISDNSVGYNGWGSGYGGYGIGSGGFQNVLSNNTVYENNGPGITIDFDIGGLVTGNVVVSNRGDGIYLSGDGIVPWTMILCRVERNTIRGNEGDGIDIENARFIKIQLNDIESNQGYGIYICPIRMSQILQNNIVNNTKDVTFYSITGLRWYGNYWGKPFIGPKIIKGHLIQNTGIQIPWYNFDWRPAKTPYLIS